jgi:hypothetical protein
LKQDIAILKKRKMKNLIIFVAFVSLIFVSCSRETIDDEKPEIDLTVSGAFPQNCDTLWLGETFSFNVLFKDNTELGSFSIEIHENFDHHAHSTEVTECNLDPVKTPANPLYFIRDFDIPTGLTEYKTNLRISLPAGNSEGNFDDGDYHFFIRLTDKEGWSEQKGLSVKLFRR